MTAMPMRSLTEQTYFRIRDDILSCRHRPGTRLNIKMLCDEMGASLGAVREAMSRLAAEGFLESTAQKGFRVSPVSVEDLEDLTKTRIAIEELCLREAIKLGELEWETDIVGAFHRLSRLPDAFVVSGATDVQAWSSANETFHSALVSACRSNWLLRIRAMLFDQADRYRRLMAISTKVDRDVVNEHRAIMEAVLERNPDLASALMAQHLQRTADIVSRVSLENIDDKLSEA
ncbi:MAG TPA: GntR family transcriptional regulator [Sphingobium sp.]|uniref:GntR family transcriptional regulator n=1 Tax=Sphingobium sp. TaxID=1912891 RepID=UPI002ED12EE0